MYMVLSWVGCALAFSHGVYMVLSWVGSAVRAVAYGLTRNITALITSDCG